MYHINCQNMGEVKICENSKSEISASNAAPGARKSRKTDFGREEKTFENVYLLNTKHINMVFEPILKYFVANLNPFRGDFAKCFDVNFNPFGGDFAWKEALRRKEAV